MTTLQIQLAVIESQIKLDPTNDKLKVLYNNTANSALIDEQIEMLEGCPKHEAMEAIERSNGLAASEYLN